MGKASQNRTRGVMADQVIDMEILSRDGESVGEIENIVFDKNGKIRIIIIDVGGFLGLGEKRVAISTDELKYDKALNNAVFQGKLSDLEQKPEINLKGYYRRASFSDRTDFGREYYPYPHSYYRDPYFYRTPYEYGPYASHPYPPRGYYSDRDSYHRDDRAPADISRQNLPLEWWEHERYRGQPEQEQMQGERGDIPSSVEKKIIQGRHLLMSALLGAEVRNRAGEVIAEIENLVISRRGRITHAVVEVGGFLDMGDEEGVVPFEHFGYFRPYFITYLGTEEQLDNLPAFEKLEFIDELRSGVEKMEGQGEDTADVP